MYVFLTHVAGGGDGPPEDGGAERVGGGALPLGERPLVGQLGLGAVG